jgi:hypothetical protein
MNEEGPLFDGRAVAAFKDISRQIEKEIAVYAEDQVHARLERVLKHPTGYYQSRIRLHQVGSHWQVDDSNVSYGPWLESGKNRHRTRFKGYFTFRKVAQLVNRRSASIAERVVRRNIGRIR